MVDMAAIGAVFGSLKSATDITKALIVLRDEQMIREKVIDLQSVILTAQQGAMAAQAAQSELLREIDQLRERLAAVESWTAERERYELSQVVPHLFVYRLSDQRKRDGEPSHMLCTQCFDEGKKSILQGQHILHCQRCKARLNLGTAPVARRQYKAIMDE